MVTTDRHVHANLCDIMYTSADLPTQEKTRLGVNCALNICSRVAMRCPEHLESVSSYIQTGVNIVPHVLVFIGKVASDHHRHQ